MSFGSTPKDGGVNKVFLVSSSPTHITSRAFYTVFLGVTI